MSEDLTRDISKNSKGNWENSGSQQPRHGKHVRIWVLAALAVCALLVLAVYERHSSASVSGDENLTEAEIEERMASYRDFVTSNYLPSDIVLAGSEGPDASQEQVRLHYNDTKQNWEAFIPADLMDDLHVYFTHFQSIQFGFADTQYKSGDLVPNLSNNFSTTMTLTLWDGSTYTNNNFLAVDVYYGVGTASLYLDTGEQTLASLDAGSDGGSDSEANEGGGPSITSEYSIYSRDQKRMQEGSLTITASDERGGSYKEEPYNLTLSNGKVWKLLPDYTETGEQARNKAALDLAHYMDIPGSACGEFVNVFNHGDYVGLYLLTSDTPLDLGSSTSITDYSADKIINSSAIDKENSNSGEDSSGNSNMGENPEADKTRQASKTGLGNSSANVDWDSAPSEVAAYADWYNSAGKQSAAGDSLYQNLWNVLDKDSFLKMYLLEDFMTTWQGSFTVYGGSGGSADHSIDSNAKTGGNSAGSQSGNSSLLYAGSPWDFVLSCGYTTRQDYPNLTSQTLWLANHVRLGDRDGLINSWQSFLSALGENQDFQSELKMLYQENLQPILGHYIQEDLPVVTYNCVRSGIMCNELYDQEKVDSDTSVWNLRQWLMKREAFLTDYLADPDSYVQLHFTTALGDLSYYVKEGSSFGTLPIEHNGEGTEYYQQSGDYDSISGWKDTDGKELKSDTVITRSMEGTTYTSYADEADN